MKENILFTCAGGAGTLYLAQSLQNDFHVFLADGNEHIAARYMGFPFRKIPFGSNPSYANSMRDLIAEWHIDYVIPQADEEILPCVALSEEGIVRCVAPNRSLVELCLHKKNLMCVLHEKKISSLLPFEKESDVQYPAIAKPVYGRGSRQVHRLDHPTQLSGYLQLYEKGFSDVLVQPYIDGDEYTVSVVVNNINQIIGIVPKRIIEKRGITRVAVSECSDSIIRVCRHIVDSLHPCGPFNVQLTIRDGVCFIFEINPRLSTTAVLTDRAFGNEVALYIQYFDCVDLSSLPVCKGGVNLFRYEAHHFVDESI